MNVEKDGRTRPGKGQDATDVKGREKRRLIAEQTALIVATSPDTAADIIELALAKAIELERERWRSRIQQFTTWATEPAMTASGERASK